MVNDPDLDFRITDRLFKTIKMSTNGRAYNNNMLAMCKITTPLKPWQIEEQKCESCFLPIGAQWRKGTGDFWYTRAVPYYSSDILEAFKIVELLVKQGYEITINPFKDSAVVVIEGITSIRSSTLPMAICLAALEVIENESKG